MLELHKCKQPHRKLLIQVMWAAMQVHKINRRNPFSSFLYLLGLFCGSITVWWQLLWEGAFSNYMPLTLVIPSATLQDFKVCLVLCYIMYTLVSIIVLSHFNCCQLLANINLEGAQHHKRGKQ